MNYRGNKMAFPDVLTQRWTMENADLCRVGEHLGFGWNNVCDEISKAGFYAEDGDGTFNAYRGDETGNEMIDQIMAAIFEENPTVNEIQISN